VNDEPIQVNYTAYTFGTSVFGIQIPFRYLVALYVEDIPTGIQVKVWGLGRATRTMNQMVSHGNELLNHYGAADWLYGQIYAKRREERMAHVRVGDRVRLLVDIGQFKKGRVCNVVEVAEPSLYYGRGGREWDDEKYPIKVLPVSTAWDKITLGPKDSIPLAMGEFGPLDQDVE
jgi:hypothetical protein